MPQDQPSTLPPWLQPTEEDQPPPPPTAPPSQRGLYLVAASIGLLALAIVAAALLLRPPSFQRHTARNAISAFEAAGLEFQPVATQSEAEFGGPLAGLVAEAITIMPTGDACEKGVCVVTVQAFKTETNLSRARAFYQTENGMSERFPPDRVVPHDNLLMVSSNGISDDAFLRYREVLASLD
jgi:hypothetical protein